VTILLVEGTIRELLLLLDVLESCFVTMIEHYFVIDQIFEIFFAKGVLFEVKIESTYWGCGWLIIREM
jgi:hypothetical protein